MRKFLNNRRLLAPLALLALCLLAASCAQPTGADTEQHQDQEAKRLLQGIWANADGGDAVLFVRGDSLFFADDTSQPARLWVYQDSLYIQASHLRQYLITKQAEHLLKFQNANGEEIKLTKDGDQTLTAPFLKPRDYALNLTRVTETDTTTTDRTPAVRCCIHTEPASDIVVKSVYNEIGLEVDNIYLDNLSKVSLYAAGNQYFQHDFRKGEFAKHVPRDFMERSVLRSVEYNQADSAAVFLNAIIGIPDAETCYVVELRIDNKGHLTQQPK